MPVLKTAKAPATSVEAYAFSGCTALETVELTSTDAAAIAANAFNGCSKMEALILRSTAMSTLANTSAFTGTRIARGEGAVYVPTALVDTYKANTNWKNYFIAPIGDYPLDDYSTIKDTWAQIFAAVDNGTYATKYAVGDTKAVSLGTYGTVYMQVAAPDADDLADGSGKAPISFVSKGFVTTHRMNATNTNANGWPSTEMRSWLESTILPLVPEEIKNRIATVTKTSYDYTTKADVTTQDKLWIPSAREVFGGTSYEQSGAVYTTLFNSAAARIKYNSSGSADSWWLRSAYSGNATLFRYVNYGGYASFDGANIAYGVALGFAIK